ncbi:MAG: ATP-binding protein [Proteobacteria bacterium]|nr:ATP-binding protein [Pseudomonadota bacterium]
MCLRVNRDECNLFFRFIAYRYERASNIITSHRVFFDWAELFYDPIIVTAIFDRLLHHSVVVNIKGNSFRLKGKINQKEVVELQKVNQRGSNSTTENGSIQKDR